MRLLSRRHFLVGTGAALANGGRARAKPGVSGIAANEIKLGTTAFYSGPASGSAAYGLAQAAYFRMVNDRGGINGRKVNFISLDNAFNPAKALEQTRRLVEADEVFAIAGSIGTPTNAATQKYLNDRGIPNLFLTSGAERFNDPVAFPWIVPFYPTFISRGILFAKFVLRERPSGRIAVQYENDDFGRDYLKGFERGLGDRAQQMIVRKTSHELTEASIDAQIVDLKSAGADVLVQFTQAKYSAQGIRAAAALGWHPLHIVAIGSAGSTFVPAGAAASKGVVTAIWERQPTDPTQASEIAVVDYRAFATKYLPNVDLDNLSAVSGYDNACMLELVLKRCGDDLTRENLLRLATSLNGETPPMFMAGIGVRNSPRDYRAIHHLQLARFDGVGMAPLGRPEPIDDSD
ncbi:ABC transporter substrate-binding protein [Bradyrhizobium sp. LTSP885]|uniref:ABC transporter substrate-binding protein n=1 Tax=Bradyrhizobium sp. LTSP885 TaxID=1619232 RepID=UPI0005CA4F11|nr:ABC transporter substrate-binding protein [Bradyrhizobium sp. LTSP885]